MTEYVLRPIGYVRSTLRDLHEAPRQGSEGAPDAWLEVDSAFATGLRGIAKGDQLIVVTWLHEANRETLEVHPRGDPAVPIAGVFVTRLRTGPIRWACSGNGERNRWQPPANRADRSD